MLSDFYPENERNTVYSIYYLAVPVGGAIGYGLGAILGSALGWRAAFLICGIPGIILALVIIQINDPVRGINDFFSMDGPEVEVETNINADADAEVDDIQKPIELNHDSKTSSSSSDRDIRDSGLSLITSNTKQSNNSRRNSKKEKTQYIINNNDESETISAHNLHDSNQRLVALEMRGHHRHHPSESTRHSKTNQFKLFVSDMWELLTNRPFMLATAGLTAGNFGLGGLSDWYG